MESDGAGQRKKGESGMERGETCRINASRDGKTLLALLRERGIYIDAPCGGAGNCGRCRVVFPENAPEPTEKERRLLTESERMEGIRLACAVVPTEDALISLPCEGRADIAAPGVETGPVREKKGNHSGRYGIAIDIGTTTLAAALVDCGTGEIAAVRTAVNHQRAYGADVISRVKAADEGHARAMRELIRTDLRGLVEELSSKTDIEPDAVCEIAVAGNTVMCHLLRGLSCRTLGEAPFTPVDLSLWEGESRELFGGGPAGVRAVVLPGISAFVGADIVAGIYGCGMHRLDSAAFFLDIGTNGEMAVGGRDGFLVTSAAAGPVFEGGNLSCGVPGIPGAVAHVTLERAALDRGLQSAARSVCAPDGEAFCVHRRELEKKSLSIHGGAGTAGMRVSCQTIGGRAPAGLCGTGVIDLVSELVRCHLIDENGAFAGPWGEEGFRVAKDVFLTQRDIREVQMGKSAIRAGIETLADAYAGEIGTVFLAGGFGYEMDVAKAARIGLFPGWFQKEFRLLGNSSLNGAARFLCEEGARGETEWIASHAREVNLAMDPGFNDRYLQYMFFADENGRGKDEKV